MVWVYGFVGAEGIVSILSTVRSADAGKPRGAVRREGGNKMVTKETPNRLWVRDSRQIIRLCEQIIRQQEFFLPRPGEHGERNRTFLFVECYAMEMLRVMRRARSRDKRYPDPMPDSPRGDSAQGRR